MCFTQQTYHPRRHWNHKNIPYSYQRRFKSGTDTTCLFPGRSLDDQCPECIMDMTSLQTQLQGLRLVDRFASSRCGQCGDGPPVFRSVEYRTDACRDVQADTRDGAVVGLEAYQLIQRCGSGYARGLEDVSSRSVSPHSGRC
jgi:hypothetical protein